MEYVLLKKLQKKKGAKYFLTYSQVTPNVPIPTKSPK